MYFQLKRLVLWPRYPDHEPRVVNFHPGQVNVISGASKTGKSAIIPIIDYCLGSEKCTIPVQTIRDACSWFGVVFDTKVGELLLARREPGSLKATGDMYVLQSPQVVVPVRIEKANVNVDTVKGMLNELAGLTQFEFESPLGIKGRPSFRDMMSFVFQPQNIVANPNVLFFKADTSEHREKLRMIFPYVLGAATPQAMAIQHELQRLQFDLRRKQREADAVREVSIRWTAEIAAKIAKAHELGLIASAPPESASLSDRIGALRAAAARPRALGPDAVSITAEGISSAAGELVALGREEAEISTALSRLRDRFADMTRFREATYEYRGSLSIRRDRLEIANWIGSLFASDHECPLCGTAGAPPAEAVEELKAALRTVEEQASAVEHVPPAFDREYLRVRADIDLESERLNAVRMRRRALQARSDEARARQYQITEAARFAGTLDEALSRYDQLASDGELVTEIADLRERITALEASLRELDVRAATHRATQRFTTFVGRVLPGLDVERPDDPVELVVEDLTIKVAGKERDDFLWEIGSGANWLSYHIATSIALHQLFQTLRTSPVPSFAVYDQPSQVYFPKQTAVPAEADPSDPSSQLRDEDIAAVRQVFAVLATAAKTSAGGWQAIVLDHAPATVWAGISGIQLVEEWRGGKTLVPRGWIE